jgi:ribosomal protein S12 methylthiotransferase accessory factor
MNILIQSNPEGKIIASYKGKEITMDDSPYMIYLSTVGMCSAVYVRAFFNQRNFDLSQVSLDQQIDYNDETKMVDNIAIHVNLPADFPAKYQNAIKAVVDQCPVKKHFVNPPTVGVIANIAEITA